MARKIFVRGKYDRISENFVSFSFKSLLSLVLKSFYQEKYGDFFFEISKKNDYKLYNRDISFVLWVTNHYSDIIPIDK